MLYRIVQWPVGAHILNLEKHPPKMTERGSPNKDNHRINVKKSRKIVLADHNTSRYNVPYRNLCFFGYKTYSRRSRDFDWLHGGESVHTIICTHVASTIETLQNQAHLESISAPTGRTLKSSREPTQSRTFCHEIGRRTREERANTARQGGRGALGGVGGRRAVMRDGPRRLIANLVAERGRVSREPGRRGTN
ncbi:hypothetical protein EVAR_89826_1 [Eumeta japonica]|uniref:Uncharacterized protein n=1 Tax=Eumeta variegata TaxID=151549 RepID=A0A4C1YJH0_EUMVA|nr:hypothetical protein EVAR_89826_1 [Eumeta japonica]